jgi:hypothetical protein
MSRVILDQETFAKLGSLKGSVVLCDPSGKAFATIYPRSDRNLEPQITDEELDERIKNPGKLYTTDEVLNHLKSL